MNKTINKLITNLYDKLFKENRRGKEWNYEDKLIKSKILQTKKTGIPPDLIDPIETRYYDKLLDQTKGITSKISFSNMKIAELGSGTGILSLRMAGEGASVELFDILPSCLQYARLMEIYFRKKDRFLGQANYINKDFTFLNGKNRYDLVHSMGVIEHFEDDQTLAMIQKMVQLTKIGSLVLVGVPNFFSPDMINIWRVSGKGNERFIGKGDLQELLIKAGLENVHVETSTFFYPSFVPNIVIKYTDSLESFLGRECGLGFLVLGIGTKTR